MRSPAATLMPLLLLAKLCMADENDAIWADVCVVETSQGGPRVQRLCMEVVSRSNGKGMRGMKRVCTTLRSWWGIKR